MTEQRYERPATNQGINESSSGLTTAVTPRTEQAGVRQNIQNTVGFQGWGHLDEKTSVMEEKKATKPDSLACDAAARVANPNIQDHNIAQQQQERGMRGGRRVLGFDLRVALLDLSLQHYHPTNCFSPMP